ncbi:MAG: cytochrome P460 family protein [Terriglobales bacterium]
MTRFWLLLCLCAFFLAVNGPRTPATAQTSANNSTAPVYTAAGKLVFPAKYREWVYLTTGLDMDYSPTVNLAEHSMFDNVFVNPEAYKAFVANGKWPDKTIFVLEGRVAGSKGSINKGGHYQTTDIMSRSIHLKDESRGGWAFFGFDEATTGSHIPAQAVCYSCHEQHGAVDTTFVQFYPTLLEIARQKGTFSPGYLKDEAEPAKKESKK